MAFDVDVAVECLVDAGDRVEFQPALAPELLCTYARLDGRPVGVIANRRGVLSSHGETRVGGILYAETSRKATYFVDVCDRHGLPLIYLQDVAGFMVGPEAEAEGIIRAGADMIEVMACASVPRIALTLNHASGAGYYAMSGQGFNPHFTFAWPTARIGVMEGDAAVMAMHGTALSALRQSGAPAPPDLETAVAQTRADYERWLDANYAAARGHVDALIGPLETRPTLAFALEAACAAAPRSPEAVAVF
jgi:acetyl-CoA carboxylase carboxyltransferase component